MFIDYLQLIHFPEKNMIREQVISNISRTLKLLALELGIVIVALSQLNRSVETRKENKVPQLSDLRESGAIEQDADVVIALHREETGLGESPDSTPISLSVLKNKDGKLGVVKLKFDGVFQRFTDLESFDMANGQSGMIPRPDNPYAGMRHMPGPYQDTPKESIDWNDI
ncbi:hypothetical protein EBR96_08855 [bacterium]|nr:hypothetical protein [bacterium]